MDDHRVSIDIQDATRYPGWTVLTAPVDRDWYSPATAKNARRGKKSSNPMYNAGFVEARLKAGDGDPGRAVQIGPYLTLG
jgi:hypothetical protein